MNRSFVVPTTSPIKFIMLEMSPLCGLYTGLISGNCFVRSPAGYVNVTRLAEAAEAEHINMNASAIQAKSLTLISIPSTKVRGMRIKGLYGVLPDYRAFRH